MNKNRRPLAESHHKVPDSRRPKAGERGKITKAASMTPTIPTVDPHAMIHGWTFFTHTLRHWKQLSTTQKIVRLAMAFALLGIAVELSTGIISSMLKQYGSDANPIDNMPDMPETISPSAQQVTSVMDSLLNTTALPQQVDTSPVVPTSTAPTSLLIILPHAILRQHQHLYLQANPK